MYCTTEHDQLSQAVRRRSHISGSR